MRIYSDTSEHKLNESNLSQEGFFLEMIFINKRTLIKVLESIPFAKIIRVYRTIPFKTEIHVEFKCHDISCVVEEPYGDNSLWWIGLTDKTSFDDTGSNIIRELKNVFINYQLSLSKRLFGYIFTFGFLRYKFKDTK